MKYLIPLVIVLLISCDMDIKQPIKQNISDNNGVIVEDTSIKNGSTTIFVGKDLSHHEKII